MSKRSVYKGIIDVHLRPPPPPFSVTGRNGWLKQLEAHRPCDESIRFTPLGVDISFYFFPHHTKSLVSFYRAACRRGRMCILRTEIIHYSSSSVMNKFNQRVLGCDLDARALSIK